MRYFTKLRKSLPMRDISERYDSACFDIPDAVLAYPYAMWARYQHHSHAVRTMYSRPAKWMA